MKVLVTGGGGFLGWAVAERLLRRGHQVRIFSRGDYTSLRAYGVETVRGDITNYGDLAGACSDCNAVVHAAALMPNIAVSAGHYYSVNVTGTETVIAACRQQGVGRLIYVSSPSVIFDGSDMCGVSESVPYPARYDSHYSRTKAIAEQTVLAANDKVFATVALRPHLIWGPGDRHLVPTLIKKARSRRLVQIGSRPHRIDVTYIDSAAEAHVLAVEQLGVETPLAGNVYFVSQGEPVDMWEFIGNILKIAGAPPVRHVVPRWLALVGAGSVETACRIFRPKAPPTLTRFLVKELSSSHWFDISAARRDLGYIPPVSIQEGLQFLRLWLDRVGSTQR